MSRRAKRVLVCGAGSIGRRHIANLLELGAEVSVWRERPHLLAEVAAEFGVTPCTDRRAGIAEADAIVVATATDSHVALASEVLEHGRALFVEKPLSHERSGIDALTRLAHGRTVEVGCQFRAHPNLVALSRALRDGASGSVLTYRLVMGHRLDRWRAADYRECYSANAARGGGALFDLIHMIDIALWLCGPVIEVGAVLSKVSALEVTGDDVANLLLTHASGATGHVQLDMAGPVHRCAAEVITTAAAYRWADAEGMLHRLSADSAEVADRVPHGHQRNDLFLAHMRHFLDRLDDSAIAPLCSLHDGVAALDVALAARAASASGRRTEVRLKQ